MNLTLQMLYAIYAWAAIAIATLIFSTASMLASFLLFFDTKKKAAHRMNTAWAKTILWFNPVWHLKIRGRGYIKNDKSYVLVANHLSMSDIICLFCLGKQFKWVAKESLFRVPFLGWAMRAAQYIQLERGKHGSIRDSLDESCDWLRRDISVLIFPEGTRSESGRLGIFKNGAFKLAIQTGKPVVPIVLTGTREIIQKKSFLFSINIHCQIKILKPIPTNPFKEGQFAELKELVRIKMLEAIESEKK